MSAKILVAVGVSSGIVLCAAGLAWLYSRRVKAPSAAAANRRKGGPSRGNHDDSSRTRLEVRIPTSSVGSVIGRSGSNVHEIESKTSTRIRFRQEEDASDGSCTVAIIWGQRESVAKAKKAIERVITSRLSQKATPTTYNMTIPHYAYGCIIGRHGTTIQEIQRSSGARIDLERHVTGAQMGACVIKGDANQIAIAKAALEDKIEEAETLRQQRAGGQRNLTRDELNSRVVDFIPRLPDKIDEFLVCVSASEHPGHFWVQVVDTQAAQLEQLNREMTRFYSSLSVDEMPLARYLPGTICCAMFEEDSRWYRARIESLSDDDDKKIDVYFVDYGDNGLVQKCHVKDLKYSYEYYLLVDVPVSCLDLVF